MHFNSIYNFLYDSSSQFGLALSYWLWSVSSTFLMFVIARVIGGVSKGNLNVSMAAMTDISSTEKRASGMVGIQLQA